MNRDLLQKLTSIRVREAHTLLRAGHYPGAYYLIGYAVECALKACISKQVKRYDFPDRKLATEAHTYELEKLIKIAGLEPEFKRERQINPSLDLNWTVVKDWKEIFRYDPSISSQQANDLYSACTGANGVLPWIRQRW